MTPEELAAKAKIIVGPEDEKRWQTALAAILQVDVTTVNRWSRGKANIKSSMAVAIEALVREAQAAQARRDTAA